MKVECSPTIRALGVTLSVLLLAAGCYTPPASQNQSRFQGLQSQFQGLRSAAKRTLPAGADVWVEIKPHVFSKPDVVIDVDSLEGYSVDKDSPYVRDAYNTQESVTRLVRVRCAHILKSIVSEQQIPDAHSIIIKAWHDVRVPNRDIGSFHLSGSRDMPVPIYGVKMPVGKMRDPQWAQWNDEYLMQQWSVESDMIPGLHFSSERRPR